MIPKTLDKKQDYTGQLIESETTKKGRLMLAHKTALFLSVMTG